MEYQVLIVRANGMEIEYFAFAKDDQTFTSDVAKLAQEVIDSQFLTEERIVRFSIQLNTYGGQKL